jgi:hypothetical protein
VYTDDSDVVASTFMLWNLWLITVLFHSGTLPPSPLSPPKDIAAQFLVLPTLQHYAPSTKNELRSRGWKVHDGYSIYLENVEWIDLGSAEGGWRGRKRRLDEELRMGVDGEDVGVLRDREYESSFRGVNWNIEHFVPRRRSEDGMVA